MTSLRVFVLGGQFSFRALFNWLSPSVYIPTMLGKTLFQMVFFTYLGRFSAVETDLFFILGNGIQISTITCVFGTVMLLANERGFGTLLASPANRFALFVGRTLPLVAHGLFVSAFGFAAACVLFGFRPADRTGHLDHDA